MSCSRCIVSILVIYAESVLCQYSRKYLVKEEISLWCKDHPYGNIYSDGDFYICPREFEDWEELGIKTTGMKGVQMRVGIIPDKKSYDFDCAGYFEGNNLKSKPTYSYYILNLLKEILGFRVELVMADTWGTYDENQKNWTGLVGLARKGNIDLGMCHTTVTEERNDVVDFLLPTLISTLHTRPIVKILARTMQGYNFDNAKNLQTNVIQYLEYGLGCLQRLISERSFVYDSTKLPLTRDVFVQTFSPMLWFCFFAATVLLVIFFRISTWAHSKLRPDHEPWSWIEVIMWANAAVCQQSYSRHPKGSSCRTTFLIGYLITYLLYTGFAAGVTSLLAVQGHDIHLMFKDVVTMKLNLVVQSDSTHFEFVKNSPDPYAKLLYLNLYDLLRRNRVETLQELFLRIESENSIGLGTTVALRNYLKRKIPTKVKDFTVSQILGSTHQKAFVLPKKSAYREAFNYWLLRLMETGLLDFGIKEYIHVEENNSCQNPGWSSAGLGNVLSAVIILGGGWFFSVLILFAEIAWKQKSSSSDWEIISRRDIYAQLMRKKFENKN